MSRRRKTKVYKDEAGEFRISQKAANGKITHASTEGYKNRVDLETNEIDSSIAIIEFYKDEFTVEQIIELNSVTLDILSRFQG